MQLLHITFRTWSSIDKFLPQKYTAQIIQNYQESKSQPLCFPDKKTITTTIQRGAPRAADQARDLEGGRQFTPSFETFFIFLLFWVYFVQVYIVPFPVALPSCVFTQLWCNIYNTKFTILTVSKDTVLWHCIHSHYCAAITIIHLQNFHHHPKLKLYTCSKLTSHPPAPGNHYCVFYFYGFDYSWYLK